MAFLAARPTRVTRATWKYTSLDRSRIQVATSAPNTPKGTAVSTARGRDQDSYWAARIRKTMTRASTKMMVVSALASFSCRAEPTQPRLKSLGSTALAARSMASRAWPEE